VPTVALTAGFVGLFVAIVLTGGLSVFQYPIRIGGKALFSWQAFVPIYFELFVLFAALATLASMVFFCKLGRWHSPLHDSDIMREITCDRFAIVFDTRGGNRSHDDIRATLEATGCRDIRPLVELEDEDNAII
jgi:hypothetical protein